MTSAPLMPMATAVWLVENTTLTFKQIAEFCNLHEVEVQGIADGEVAKGIVGYNPIISGQLAREEIKLSSEDQNRPLNLKTSEVNIESSEKKNKKIYTFVKTSRQTRFCIVAYKATFNSKGFSNCKINWNYQKFSCFHKKQKLLEL